MFFPPRDVVNKVKEQYPAGSRVELISMNDPYRDIPSGTKGTVTEVDDTGTIHVHWDIEKSKAVVAKAVEGVADEMMITPLKATSKVEVFSEGDAASSSHSESYGSTSITIQQMVVRNDDDIRRISQELNSLMQSGRRARGLI